MSRCFIDEEQNPCLDTDEDCKFHIDTVQDQRSMRDGTVLKQAIRYVGIELLTRERLISAQKEELTFSIEQAEKVHIYYLLFHERLSIDEKWRPSDATV